MVVKNVGLALRYCIPQMVGQKIGNFWVIDTTKDILFCRYRFTSFNCGLQELIKPLIDFKYEVIETRMNSMFELATQDEIDKLKGGGGETETDKSSEELQLDDLEVTIGLVWWSKNI